MFFKGFVAQLYNQKSLLDLPYKFQRIMTFVNGSDRGHVFTAASFYIIKLIVCSVYERLDSSML